LTRVEDIAAAVGYGVDAIGLVLVPTSRRALTLEAAVALRQHIPPMVSAVALFQNAEPAFVVAAIEQLRPDLLQFHGGESADYCAAFARPYIYALPMGGGALNVQQQLSAHTEAGALLLDAHAPGALGGQGVTFDWTQIPPNLPKPLILAGGLKPETVAAAIRSVRPYGVDVSSGIEVSPGIKDSAKMAVFIEEVQRGDSSR